MKRIAIFTLLLLAAIAFVGGPASAQDEMTYTVTLGGNDELGQFFTDADGMTLYIFTNDEPGVSNCSGDCLAAWPALTVDEGVPTLDPAISGVISLIAREDGTEQVAYNGMPLYYWQNDAAPGDATGHNVGDVWFVATMPTVGLGGNAELGNFLVGDNGLTLYIFTNDEPGVSNCSGDCLAAWPAVTVDSEEALSVEPGLAGDFGVITRDDGSLQVTYNDAPLYFWQNDAVAGDATGQNVGDVWFVVSLPTISVAESEAFGSILVGPNGMTLYTFANDDANVSNCSGGCLANWPALTVTEAEAADLNIDGAAGGEVSVFEREDGTLQVAYNGAPLYYWVRDAVPGDTNGHNVGDVWFVAQP